MEENTKIQRCPYCGGENIQHMGENDYWNGNPWHCHECDSWFNQEDVERETLRHTISPMLSETSEESPRMCEIVLDTRDIHGFDGSLLDGWLHTSSPVMNSIFLLEDGTIWLHFRHDKVSNNGKEETNWRNLDDLSLESLRKIARELPMYGYRYNDDNKSRIWDLKERNETISERILDEKGPNMSYCDEMDTVMRRTLLELLESDLEDIDNERRESIFSDIHFMAENDTWLPMALKDASLETAVQFIEDNHRIILNELEKNIKLYEKEFD